MEAEDLMIAADLLKKNIGFEYKVDVESSWTGVEDMMRFVMRSQSDYTLEVIKKTIFEGDGDIYKFFTEGIDLMPTYVMVSDKTFKE